MVGWHHRLDGHEFEQAPGVVDGQGHLFCLGVSWPASLAGAEMRCKGDRRGESRVGEVGGADFRLYSGGLYFFVPSGGGIA